MSRDDVFGQLHGRADVEVDDLQFVLELGVGREGSAGAPAGVQRGRRERSRAGAHLAVQLVDAGLGGEVDLDCLDAGPGGLSSLFGGLQAIVLGGDDQVKAVVGELLGELEPDAAGGAGDKCEWMVFGG